MSNEGLELGVAKAWLALSEEERSTAGVLTTDDRMREDLSRAIREELKKENILSGEPIFVGEDASMELMAGDKIKWTEGLDELGIKAGQTVEIIGIGDQIEVEYQTEEGKTKTFSAELSVFNTADYAFTAYIPEVQSGQYDAVIGACNSLWSRDFETLTTIRDAMSQESTNTILVTDSLSRVNEKLIEPELQPIVEIPEVDQTERFKEISDAVNNSMELELSKDKGPELEL